MRERQHDDPGLGPRVLVGLLHVLEEVLAGADRDLPDVGAGEQRAPDVDRVRRRRHQGGVARLEQHPHEVREALLGPDGRDDLGLGVEGHAEAAHVEVGDGLAQLRDAPAGRVPVVAAVVHGLAELVDRGLRRRQVGVAEPEVDHVLAGSPGLHLQPVDDREDVRRQRGDAAELHRSTVGSVRFDLRRIRSSGQWRATASRPAPMAAACSPSSAASIGTSGRWSAASTRLAVGGPGGAEDEVAGLGQPTRDHDHIRVEDVHEVGQPERDPPREAAQDLLGGRVALARRVGHVLAPHVLGLTAGPLDQASGPPRRGRPRGPAGRGRCPTRSAPSTRAARTGRAARSGRRPCGRAPPRTRWPPAARSP